MTRICILYARKEKSKNFLYIEGMEMTVTDCHRKEGSAENGTRKKFLDFWERFVFDRH